MHLKSLTLILLGASVSSAQYIKEVMIKIPDVEDAELDSGDYFQLEITNANLQTFNIFLSCRTNPLLNAYDSNMQRNEVDVYSGDVLDLCDNFALIGGVLSDLTVINGSTNNYGIEWIRFLTSDNNILQCNLEQYVTGDVISLTFPGSICSTPY